MTYKINIVKKPNQQTEIRNLKRLNGVLETHVAHFSEKARKAELKVKALEYATKIQGEEINEWKARFDALLGLKGDKCA